MKIGFDAKRVFHNFTGLGNYSRFVVDALRNRFPDNEYLLYTPGVKPHPETAHYLSTPGVTIRQANGRPGAWWRSFSIVDDLHQDQLDVYHGLSNELPLRRAKGVKMVLTVHDLIFIRFPEYYSFLDAAIYRYKLAKSCQRADIVVAVSKQTASDLVEFLGVDPRKIQVVYQGCHPSFFQRASAQEKERVRVQYQLPQDFVLYLGTLEKRKNAGVLIRALAAMKKRVPVVLVGRRTPYVDELEALVSRLGVGDFVKFIHQAKFSELPTLYQMASVFVYPSVFEGFGIPIVEAIASGVPVITSNGSCFSEAGGPDCIYVNPSNAEELADSITLVLENSGFRNNMVEGSRSYIERFAPPVIAGQLHELYRL